MGRIDIGVWRFLRRKWQRLRIQRCSHTPWIIIQRAEDLWWKAIFGLEFYRGQNPPDDTRGLGGWVHARVAVCSRCGGVLDEITLANNALADKKRVVLHSWEHGPFLKDVGNIHDFR